MAVEFFDHTADVGARITAGSVQSLFAEAALALTATLTEPGQVAQRSTRSVTLRAPDLTQLLVDWLTELVGWFDIDQFLVAAASPTLERHPDGWQLVATVQGEPLDPARHSVRVLVKGVTYHGLEVTQHADTGWEAAVVFDI